MFKEISFIIIIISTLLCSCGNSAQETYENDSIKAEQLLLSATESLENNRPNEALLQINLIDSVYKNQIGVRRKAMKLLPQIKELLIIKEIQQIDSLLVEYEINNPGAEAIYKAQVNKTKLERQLQVARNQIARMTEDSIQ